MHCEKQNKDEIQIDYDHYHPFIVCGGSFTPLVRGSKVVYCPYCQTSYKTEYQGKLCRICDISKIGAPATGLKCRK
jgi:coatomer protein complex subunit alpha (xenin)